MRTGLYVLVRCADKTLKCADVLGVFFQEMCVFKLIFQCLNSVNFVAKLKNLHIVSP